MTTTTRMQTTGAPYALGIGGSRALVACSSFEEASSLYRAACEAMTARTGKGASGIAEGSVYDTRGAKPTLVARVSWNGKVWAAKPWATGDEPLFNPYAIDAAGAAR